MNSLKSRPNNRNMSTQHIATLLGATWCVRLATVLWCVATCWALLAQVWNWSNLSQQHPTCRNMSQHGGQNARNMLRPTMLWHVVLACCDRRYACANLTHEKNVCALLHRKNTGFQQTEYCIFSLNEEAEMVRGFKAKIESRLTDLNWQRFLFFVC